MKNNSFLQLRTRSRLTLAVLAALSIAPVMAQDAAPAAASTETPAKPKDVNELDTVVVTGTHTAGLSPVETISPVDVFVVSQLAQQATFDFTDSLTKLTPALNTQRFPIADGTAFVRPVTLRNLAPDQTMVLVNGVRRHRSA